MLELAVPFWQMWARCGLVNAELCDTPFCRPANSAGFLWKIELGCASGERRGHYIYDDHQDKRTI
jgi:hypothetical protein